MSHHLQVIEDWFEYGLFPHSQGIDIPSIRQFCKRLHGLDTISVEEFLSNSTIFQNLPQNQCHIYYQTVQAFLSTESHIPTSSIITLLFVQLFHHRSLKEQAIRGDEYPKSEKVTPPPPTSSSFSPRCKLIHSLHTESISTSNNSNNSSLASPRLSSRSLLGDNDLASILSFVRNHIYEFLVFLYIYKTGIEVDNFEKQVVCVKDYVPELKLLMTWAKDGFEGVDLSENISLKNLSDWISISLQMRPIDHVLFLTSPEGFIYGIDKTLVTGRAPIGLLSHKKGKTFLITPEILSGMTSLRIHKCHGCTIYILAPVSFVTLSDCTSTTFFIAAVQHMVHVYHSDQLKVISACGQFSVSASRSITCHLFTPRAPLLWEPLTKDIVLAPFNTNYNRLKEHLVAARLDPTSVNMFNLPRQVTSFSSTVVSGDAYRCMNPIDFFLFQVPFTDRTSNSLNLMEPKLLISLPEEYSEAISKRIAFVQRARETISKKTTDPQDEIHAAIEARFQVWMRKLGLINEIHGLLDMASQINK